MPEFSTTAIHHTAINVSDFDRSLAFYRDTMGLTLLWETDFGGRALAAVTGLPEPHTRIALLSAGQQHVEIFQYLTPPATNRVARPCDVAIIHIGMVVTDIQKAYEELTAKGVRFNCPPIQIKRGPQAGWTFVYCYDPDGMMLELMQVPIDQSL